MENENCIILTRYLYVKQDVLLSLQESLTRPCDYEKSLFWAFELYYSGFEDEVCELLQVKENRPTKIAERIFDIFARLPSEKRKRKVILSVNITESFVEKYKTVISDKPWKILREQCVYESIKVPSITQKQRIYAFRDNWETFAYRSPVWKERIDLLGLEDDTFYDLYGYEPDEQSLQVQMKCALKKT
jgi:hypothetical protein